MDLLSFGTYPEETMTHRLLWALAALLDGQPSYRPRFRRLPAEVASRDFNARFRQRFAADWDQLNDQWEVFTANLEHGFHGGREG